ncbi:MAG: hypothetical protein KGL02_12695 [Acidobacteriota bacterium]|nr:hypothetical protein [Acidobacteriota bacterium]
MVDRDVQAAVYLAIVLGTIAVGCLLVWFIFRLVAKSKEDGAPRPSSLTVRIFKAGALALFLTPSLIGWYPVPCILALLYALTQLGDPYSAGQSLTGISKAYVVGWIIIFSLAELISYLRNNPRFKRN